MAESKDFRWDRWWKYTNDEIRLFAWPIVFAMFFGFFLSSLYIFPKINLNFIYGNTEVFKAIYQYLDLKLLYFYSLTFANFAFFANSSNITKKVEYQLANFSLPISTKERALSDLYFVCILIPFIHFSIYFSILYIYKTSNYSKYIMVEIGWTTLFTYIKAYLISIILVLPFISIFKYKSLLIRILTIFVLIISWPIIKFINGFNPNDFISLYENKISALNNYPSILLLIPIAIMSLFLLYYSIKEKEIK